MGLEHVRQRASRAGEEWGSSLDALVRLVAELSEEVRSLSHRLHPSVLDDLGLEAALRQLTTDLQRTAGLTVRLTSNLGGTVALPDTVATALYRIAQEALRNILRHARDASVTVSLLATSDEVRLSVRDDGPGMDVRAVREKGGLGLVSMRERANLAGGSLEIRSAPAAGTEVVVAVPCWWVSKP